MRENFIGFSRPKAQNRGGPRQNRTTNRPSAASFSEFSHISPDLILSEVLIFNFYFYFLRLRIRRIASGLSGLGSVFMLPRPYFAQVGEGAYYSSTRKRASSKHREIVPDVK